MTDPGRGSADDRRHQEGHGDMQVQADGDLEGASDADDQALRPAVRRRSAASTDEPSSLDPRGPLEPQDINVENALFVVLGIVLSGGFLLVGLYGLF